MRGAFTRWDGALIALLVAVNAIFLLHASKSVESVEILSDAGALSARLPSDRRLQVQGPLGATVVELGPNGARIVSSPCPNRLCVRAGWATAQNPVVACVPNRVVVRVRAGSRDVDAVTR